jgi:hypothetical protein
LASRGRRKRVVRILYLYGSVFLLMATFTDLLVYGVNRDPYNILFPRMSIGPLFPLYLIYAGLTVMVAFNNVLRARRRCLTTVTYRRMTYLLAAFPMPAIGIFPYALVLPPLPETAVWVWLLFNLGNVAVVLMLAFMAYPLAFYGQNRPDRVIKSELLRFFLRGPLTGIAVLLVILFLPGARLIGLPGPEFLPFVAVATVLLMQWGIALALPTLDRWLVYGRDQEDAIQLRELGEHMLTRADSRQLLDTILAAMCEHLRSPSAFVVSFNGQGPKIEGAVGPLTPSKEWLESPALLTFAEDAEIPADATQYEQFFTWQSYWLIPLYSERLQAAPVEELQKNSTNGVALTVAPPAKRAIGLMGIWARAPQPDLKDEELPMFEELHHRASRVLDDTRLQGEILAALKGLLPEIDAVQRFPATANAAATRLTVPKQAVITSDPEFTDLIRDALRDYWGGPRLTEGRLLELNVIRRALAENDGNPARAVRAILGRAIESLKPEGQPNLSNEWMLYNVLDMRFVQGRKVLEVADKLAMSEANLHRKQRVAIEQVAQRVAEMERESANATH